MTDHETGAYDTPALFDRLETAADPPESVAPEQLDCVDSGINSVETVEFQPDQEVSFEQSLLRIIDEKLGRGPATASEGNLPRADGYRGDSQERTEPETSLEMAEDTATANSQADFEKLRLQFQGSNQDAPLNGGSKFGAKEGSPIKVADSPIELKDYRKEWSELGGISSQGSTRRNLQDSVTFRRNRKPTIVFLHGFGSSAEIFEHQLQYFSSLGYPCIAPDMLGHGMSSAPGRSRDYHFGKLLKDLDAVLHHYAFKPGEKCVLVAHNYG